MWNLGPFIEVDLASCGCRFIVRLRLVCDLLDSNGIAFRVVGANGHTRDPALQNGRTPGKCPALGAFDIHLDKVDPVEPQLLRDAIDR